MSGMAGGTTGSQTRTICCLLILQGTIGPSLFQIELFRLRYQSNQKRETHGDNEHPKL